MHRCVIQYLVEVVLINSIGSTSIELAHGFMRDDDDDDRKFHFVYFL